tara:strand:+ start:42293 stop:43219 length:927 start_codon:yes stop_codon:yes gene_type:complete
MAPSETPRHLQFLIAVDRSPGAEPHLTFGVRLGDALDAQSTLFHAVPPHQIAVNAAVDPADAPLGDDANEARQSLCAIANSLHSDRPVRVEVETDKTSVDAILAAADRLEADLIVLPTHGRTGISRAVLGSTAEQVMRRSTRPVLLLTDHMLANESDPAADQGPVVLATDLSPDAQVAHGPAATFARRLNLPLQLLSIVPAVEPLPYRSGAPVNPPQPDAAALIGHREQQLRKVAEEIGAGVHSDVQVVMDDNAAGAIVNAAKSSNAALLVLATHGRRGIERLLKGSVAEQIVRHATVPVVCMPVAKP